MEEHQIVLLQTERDRYFDLLGGLTEELGSEHAASIEEQILVSGIEATVATIRSSVG